jgi:ubiquinone/menaquinone biosynthesis C-methylase UbiE
VKLERPTQNGQLHALPAEDKTPSDWMLPENQFIEKVKKPLRSLLYPIYLKIIDPILRRRYERSLQFDVNQWYWGHRGFEYQFLRAKLNRYRKIRGSSVLVVGCGTGRDLASWIARGPVNVVGVDLFNYQRAWDLTKIKYGSVLTFVQSDISSLSRIEDGRFDIVGSDAVFEHVTDLSRALKESYRVLKTDGLLYASFGPLWHCWGGDHISGYDTIAGGYNHLLLQKQDYLDYLARAGNFAHSEDDGRTWVNHGLFSYLKIQEYLSVLQGAGFAVVNLGVIVEPRGVKFLKANPGTRAQLLKLASELDLIAAGLYIVARKTVGQNRRSDASRNLV